MDFTRLRGTQVYTWSKRKHQNIKHVEMVGNEINHVANIVQIFPQWSIRQCRLCLINAILLPCISNPLQPFFFRIKVPLKNIHFGSGKINIFKSVRNYFIGYIVLICYMHIGNKNAPLFVIFRNIKIKTIWFFLHISAMVSVFLSLFGGVNNKKLEEKWMKERNK